MAFPRTGGCSAKSGPPTEAQPKTPEENRGIRVCGLSMGTLRNSLFWE
jgi:hypothetical protein